VALVRTLLTGAQESAWGALQFLSQFLEHFLGISSGGSSGVSYGVSYTERGAEQYAVRITELSPYTSPY